MVYKYWKDCHRTKGLAYVLTSVCRPMTEVPQKQTSAEYMNEFLNNPAFQTGTRCLEEWRTRRGEAEVVRR